MSAPSPGPESEPLVSVVIATYNRCRVLNHALRSLLSSEYRNWEGLVIGDACTDATAKVVASFQDPRLRFINLAENTGEQTGPNNYGCSLARGRYLAFLNHDDLWFPDHLALCLRHLQKTGAGLVYGIGVVLTASGGIEINSISRGETYRPYATVPASLWLFARELWESVGPWRFAREIYSIPSQEWLWRCYRKGAKIQMVPQVTAIHFPSGFRKGSYGNTEDREFGQVADALTADPRRYREELITRALIKYADAPYMMNPAAGLKKILKWIFYSACQRLGIPYRSLASFLRYRRRGGLMKKLRKNRGLPPR